jgi:hypothetical protein
MLTDAQYCLSAKQFQQWACGGRFQSAEAFLNFQSHQCSFLESKLINVCFRKYRRVLAFLLQLPNSELSLYKRFNYSQLAKMINGFF